MQALCRILTVKHGPEIEVVGGWMYYWLLSMFATGFRKKNRGTTKRQMELSNVSTYTKQHQCTVQFCE